MKKKNSAIFVLSTALFGLVLASCGGTTTPSKTSTAGNTSSVVTSESSDYSNYDNNILTTLDKDFWPDVNSVDADLSGKIDVEIITGKLLPGWQKVASEYEKIHNGNVVVSIDSTLSKGTYADKLKNALNSSNTDWDIVQGNYQNALITSKGINMYSYVSTPNAYAGEDIYWNEVMSTDAYQTDKSGRDTSVYTLNSEFLSTGWFVQEEALAAAGEQGYKNANNEVGNPVTFDDIINLCSAMVKAGYKNPLGLAGDAESISASQFAWLFRVYGDQYYRELTPLITPQEGDYDNSGAVFTLEDTDTQPEAKSTFTVSATRLYNLTFDKTSENYYGPTSAKYVEFITQLQNLMKFASADFKSLSHDDVRNQFQYQSKSKESPQIFLDYSGYYLTHTADKTSKGTISAFDYPYMTGENVSYKFVRDVGGNGGYLSVVKHTDDQDALNMDFLKFFMSPYGQSVYYNALYEKGVAPDGISTICDEDGSSYFSVPESWDNYFKNSPLKFNGLCDMSNFTNTLIYHFNGDATTISKNKELVWYLFDNKKGASGGVTPEQYGATWYDCIFKAYKDLCKSSGWNEEMYKFPGQEPSVAH